VQPLPLQLAKTDPEAGIAVSVTVVPPENDREQVVPQLMPLGLLVTVPLPVPFLAIWSVNVPPLPLPLAFKPPAAISAVWLGRVGGSWLPHPDISIHSAINPAVGRRRILVLSSLAPPECRRRSLVRHAMAEAGMRDFRTRFSPPGYS